MKRQISTNGKNISFLQLPISYTPDGAAAATGRSRTRIYLAIKNGEIIARKDGKATIIEDSELRRWVQTFPIIRANEIKDTEIAFDVEYETIDNPSRITPNQSRS